MDGDGRRRTPSPERAKVARRACDDVLHEAEVVAEPAVRAFVPLHREHAVALSQLSSLERDIHNFWVCAFRTTLSVFNRSKSKRLNSFEVYSLSHFIITKVTLKLKK